MAITAIVAAVVSVVGAAVSVIYSVITMRAQAQKEVGDLYDQMVKFRVEHPVVLRLSRKWEHGHWKRIYEQPRDTDDNWVAYYCYVELCIGYCNMVLSSRLRLSRASYLHHHRQLVKLVLTENNPIIEDLLREGKYISEAVKGFRKEMEIEGWNWADEHKKLAM